MAISVVITEPRMMTAEEISRAAAGVAVLSADEPWMVVALNIDDLWENASYEELLAAQDFNGEQAERDAWNDMPAGER